MKYTIKELSLIWLDSFIGLEYKHKVQIYQFLSQSQTVSQGLMLAKDYILSSVGENEFKTMLGSANQTYLDFVLSELERRDIVAITIESDRYPNLLNEVELKPLVLYAKGNLELLDTKSFAIVGSRKSLPLSISIAGEYAKSLSQHFTLVTGIAEGVDSEVIKSALSTTKNIISVIAGGFDNIYPSTNKDLFEKVASVGLVLSEHPPKVVPKPYHFPIRNRIIAGLSIGVLVVSGGLKSGTLYTAEYAGEYARDLFAVPYSVGVASGQGTNELIKRGAVLTDKVEDILEFYSLKNNDSSLKLSKEEKEILSVLANGNAHIEKICGELNKSAHEMLAQLSILEIKGVIVKSGNVYGLVRNYSED